MRDEFGELDRSHWAKPRERQTPHAERINTTEIGMPIEPAPDGSELIGSIPVIGSTTTLLTATVSKEDARRLRAAGRPVPKDIFAFLGKVDARLVALVGSFAVGFSPVLIRMAGENASTSVLFRFGLALVPLLILASLEWRLNGPMDRRSLALHLLGGVFFGLDVGLWTHGVMLAGAGIATVAGNLQVIIVPLIAFLIFREKLSIAFLASIPIMLTGVLLLSGILESGDLTGDVFVGVLLSVAGGIAYSGYILILGRTKPTGHASTQVFIATLATTVVGSSVASAFGAPNLTPEPRALLLLLLTAIAGQVIGWIATSNALGRLDSATGSMLLLIQPLIAIFAGLLLLHEQISLLQWVGVIAIILTVAFISVASSQRKREEKALARKYRMEQRRLAAQRRAELKRAGQEGAKPPRTIKPMKVAKTQRRPRS